MIYNGHYGATDDLALMVRRATAALRPHLQRFSFIATSGMSGVLVGAPVSIRLKRPLVIVRKPGDVAHTYSDVVGGPARGAYVVLDDFISFGHTYSRIRTRLERSDDLGPLVRYAGVYLYSDELLSWAGDELVTWHPERKDWTRVEIRREDAPMRGKVNREDVAA